jgi:fatty acid synthase, animal type
MASAKHIGKVLLKVRENANDEHSKPISVLPRFYCNPNMSYLIVGALGGFGLELVDWLIIRGCKKIVLSSSRGMTNSYQATRLK